MNAQEAIEKRLKEIDESIENYEKSITELEDELSNELAHHKQLIVCRTIDNKTYHLHILKEIKRELEAIIE